MICGELDNILFPIQYARFAKFQRDDHFVRMFRNEQHVRCVIDSVGFGRQCDGDRFLADTVQDGEMVVRVEDAFLIGIKMHAGRFGRMAQELP